MLGKLALIGTLGLCTAFGLEQGAQDPERPREPEALAERLERMAELFEERFERQMEALEEELERRVERAERALERRIEELEESFERQMEALEARLEEFEDAVEAAGESAARHGDADCTPSRASSRSCTPSRSLLSRFHRAHREGRADGARSTVEAIVQRHGDSLGSLNNLAWELLTGDQAGQHDELAMALAQRMLDSDGDLTHYMKDTVALALFRTGEVERAVELQREAIAEGGGDDEYRARLRTYEQALGAASQKRIH